MRFVPVKSSEQQSMLCVHRLREGVNADRTACTKRGDAYLRTLLIQGAKSVVNTAHTRSDPISKWVLALKERSGWQKAVVALA